MQVFDIPTPDLKKEPIELELDPEWLCILKATNHLLNLSKSTRYMPGPGCNERFVDYLSPVRMFMGDT